ncbi:MAG: 16S rRNA (adenine(1518)-N(6)/adenine(1519)-N(6))-dimethyltransferase RsmA [Fimbriimonadaceae bacterium]|nr:ribosomal RNA small subunit methyltransferase A [Chthonomonadaceae bacterium]MCO5298024.1 16S rRNA (adenine(1518)-N(6)/adenine(1519)-N(6))-dimethyltransferase RsmA [Fimbriimonadaceae bacterium]
MNLANPATLRAVLALHGIDARKGLGQHFLCSTAAVAAIVARFEGFAGLLEIGPGPGVLTAPLSRGAKVIALELDEQMAGVLAESAPRADVRLQDAAKADLGAILAELPAPRGVVSNLPYYLTGLLVQSIADAHGCFDKAVLMMQREVAERILAQPGERERGSLSVYLQARFTLTKVCHVPAGSFLPPPKVDSLVLELVPTGSTLPEAFFAVVRAGFAQPRKTLANNLAASGRFSRSAIDAAIVAEGHSPTVRAHMLSLAEWERLFERLEAARGG